MYNSSSAYEYDYFDGIDYSAFEPRSNTAPAYDEPVKRKKKKTVVTPIRKTTEKQKKSTGKEKVAGEFVAPTKKQVAEIKLSAVRVAVLLGVSALFLTLISMLILCRVTVDTISRENKNYENLIEIANSENVRLNTELDSMFSPDKIEDYAINVLGMVKLEDYKVTYFDFTNEDKVILSGNKEYNK